jgi:signal peptidase I
MDDNLTKEFYEWTEAVAFSVAVIVITFTFIFRIVGVKGVSMENTLNAGVTSENQTVDRVVISDIDYKPKRGDIVVLATDPVGPIIKRVIAVGGDTVDIDFEKHTVSVNGKILDEPYIKEPTSEQGDVAFPQKVPEGHAFVMGDNRNDSFDSRFGAIGMVDDRNIQGKAILRIYPLNEIGILR